MFVANATSSALNPAGSAATEDFSLCSGSVWPSDAGLSHDDRNRAAARAARAAAMRAVMDVMTPPYRIPHRGIDNGLARKTARAY